ncbi:glutamate racemase [Candidatus Vallotiella sp. (ex Adelges kitamiensis)]|uniref:glutamate racemase n=1 Tax=Candidatus Vallotiella sp. (ex Adelges kitamiensis) TaxID=2864217 RepID=UPI001CE346FB|nr:glutamate racemase [Candidatus Vallotia sp. (ex Adelges kitamiensis)]
MRNAAPIGVLDSGVGGLSVLRSIRAALPDETLLYCADSCYAPYGERKNSFITARTLGISRWLEAQHVKAIVVACNTATAHTLLILRERLKMPIIGVEPGIRIAALRSRTRVAGVLATTSTLKSERFNALLAQYSGDCRFICQHGRGLVEAIEVGDVSSPVVMQYLSACIQPILDSSADTLVLGCTHYSFLWNALCTITAKQLYIVDTHEAIASQLVRQLTKQRLLINTISATTHSKKRLASPTLRLISTGDALQLTRIAQKLIGVNIDAEHVKIASEPF